MKWWIKVWFLCWWEHLDDLLGRPERVNMDCPDLCHLAGELWCEMCQVNGWLAVIRQPHEITIDEDREVVS